ncbi:uncharacterized protein LOC142881830 isoform X2 [Nelusetta ayraudi]|uniref:uncharacterized protein LOC142881830 isoform X2 n=1 Tax=Nelusetta ayraudi TaxID=303726 RepID=UPI003F70BB4B
MDSFETPYEEDSEYIECTVCEKSIRGETLYKIHVTSPGHLKKEDSLVSMGVVVRQRDVPRFENIVHYLDYMKLDEPIIGLNYVEEVSVADPQGEPRFEPRYTCLLCRQNAPLTEMLRHLIGRKHRQKYLETKRPDLVTWDKQTQATQSGKVIRARAEIVERQDGRGHPVLLPVNKMNKPNFYRDPQKQTNSWGLNYPQSSAQSEPPFHPSRLMDFNVDPTMPNRCPPERRNTPPAHSKDSYMPNSAMRDEDPISRERYGGDLRRADYRDGDVERERRDYREPEFQRDYKEFGRNEFESRAEPTGGQAQREDPPYGRPYPERGSLKEFYSKDVRDGQSRPAEYESQEQLYSDADSRRQSLDRELQRQVGMNRSGGQGLSEPESNYRGFSSAAQGEWPFDTKVTIQDYGHKSREVHQEDYNCDPGPRGRPGLSISHRQAGVSRCMADIPEPFKRFLSGPAIDTDQGKRKRKSRFSDASAEEMETAKNMLRDDYGPPKPKFADSAQPTRPPGPRQTESFQRGGSDSGTVFDLLSNIEIDNMEEADFLKNKLCDLLKEFKAKKMEKAGKPPSRETFIKEYNNFSAAVDLPPKAQYERQRLDDLDLRSPADVQEDCRERGWKQHNNMAEKPHQEFLLPSRGNVGHTSSTRSLYEEVIGRRDMTVSSRGYSENFQEPFQTRDYRPAGEQLVDIRSSVPPPHMLPQEKAVRYTNNLDKITSTLLELVRRQ